VAKEHIQPMDVGSDEVMCDIMGHGMEQTMEHQGGGRDTSGEAVVSQQLQHTRAQQWLKSGKGSQQPTPKAGYLLARHGTDDDDDGAVNAPVQEGEESCATLAQAPSKDIAISYDDLLARLTDVETQLQLRKQQTKPRQ
jgi:hypothetical protein